MGPVPVGVQVVAPHAVDRSSEFVATVRSRRSSEIRPQVEGIITRIFVRSGARVAAGTPLMQIDPAKQQATVASDAASRVAQEAAVRWAHQEHDRQQKLFQQGLTSRQALDQTAAALDTAQASLNALKAREQESEVTLEYYRVSAPTAGFIGDIPVRVGDRVTDSTVLTTIDENAGLEAYIYVPIERAVDLRVGLLVSLVDDRGTVLADSAVTFVSPQVDNRTQQILVKAPVPPGRSFRNDQFVRARVIWNQESAVTIPVLAVSRVNGQYYAFVAEAGQKGTVARQRPLKLGDLVGNEYIVLDGLKPGERVVISGIQKLADGVPVQATQS
jgi:RND family efflux transporter MFP subunit